MTRCSRWFGVTVADSVGLDPVLREVIVCPACHGRLDVRDELLVCAACAVGYPVRDGVPVLLADDAVPLSGPGAGAPNGDDRA